MIRSKLFPVLTFLVALSFGSAQPQQPASAHEIPSAPTGSVTGFVYDSDTRLPVRFAEINLVPIPSPEDGTSAKNQPVPPGVAQQRAPRVQLASGTSGMDGGFHLDVPEGHYLVTAVKPGYITPGTAAAMDFSLSAHHLTQFRIG